MDSTKILEAVGGDGPFQYILIVTSSLLRIAGYWTRLFFSFGNYQPPWKCIVWRHNVSLELGALDGWNSTDEFISPRDPHSCDIYKACAEIEFEPGSSTLVTEFELMCDKAWVTSFFVTSLMTGHFVGAVIGGQLAERFGRRFILYWTTLIHAICTLCSAFSSSWELYVAWMFVLGLCLGCKFVVCLVYIIEFSGPTSLTILKVVPIMGIGGGIFGFMVYFDRDWKSLSIIRAIVSFATCVPAVCLPESMRWLYVQGRIDKCEAVARQISKWNRQKEMPEINIEKLVVEKDKTTYMDLFRTKYLALTTLGINFIWFSTFAVYYMLSLGVKSFAGDFYINLILFNALEIPVFIFVLPAVRWTGNRKAISSVVFIAFICMSAAVVVHYTVSGDSSDWIITYLAMVAKLCLSGCSQMSTVYTGELYPTVIRGLGQGLAASWGVLGLVVGPYLIPTSPAALPICFSVSALLLLLVCVVLYFLPETKHRSIEDLHTCNGYIDLSSTSSSSRE